MMRWQKKMPSKNVDIIQGKLTFKSVFNTKFKREDYPASTACEEIS